MVSQQRRWVGFSGFSVQVVWDPVVIAMTSCFIARTWTLLDLLDNESPEAGATMVQLGQGVLPLFLHLSPSYEDFLGQHELIRWAGHSV